MKLLFTILLLLHCSIVRAELEEDNNYVVASLLVAQPGEVLYSCVGHAFLRMECPSQNLDFCFSYEGEPIKNQVTKFMAGKLKMGMFAVETNDFLEQYGRAGRGVKEYKLNLPLKVKKRMWQHLDEMCSEGVRLPYDYVKRGCAISCKNIVESALLPQQFISYTEWPGFFAKTRGEILIERLGDNYPWNRFFLYSIAGREAWEDVSIDEKLIIPADLVSAWQTATIDGEPIIKDAPCELVSWNTQKVEKTVITPLLLSLLFFVICLAASVFGWSLVRFFALLLQAVIGVILAYIFFVSNLPNTSWTWLIIPFNPLPLLFYRYIKQLATVYSIVILLWLLGMVVYPVKMVDYSYYVLCLSLLIIFNTIFIQKAINFMRKFNFKKALLLFTFVLLAVLPIYAGGADELTYYWFHNHLTAYPTGKGLVYGTEDPEVSSSDLTAEDWKDEMTCKYYSTDPSLEFYAFAKPAPGYQTVGWFRNDNGVPGEFMINNSVRSLLNIIGDYINESEIDPIQVTFNPFLNIADLSFDYSWNFASSYDDSIEYYSCEPDNDLMAVFGKVGIDMQFDRFDFPGINEANQDAIQREKLFQLHTTWKEMQPYISNPANDNDDRIELGVNQSFSQIAYGKKDTVVERYEYVEKIDTIYIPEIVGCDTIYLDEAHTEFVVEPIYEDRMELIPDYDIISVLDTIQTDDYDNPIKIHYDFSFWSNDKGEKFYTPIINVDVVDLDTYVFHVDVSYSAWNENEEDNIEFTLADSVPDNDVYTIQGTLVKNVGTKGLKPGLYIIGGKKVTVK